MGDGYTTAAEWWVFLGLFGVYFIGYQWHRHLKGKGTVPPASNGWPVRDQ